MALILNIETATKACSVALAKDGILLNVKESNPFTDPLQKEYIHSDKLSSFIQDVFINAGIEIEKTDAIAVSKGPGSYTGLRIGVSMAKGLCYALNKPLIAVETLMALTLEVIPQLETKKNILFCPMLDARRMEVYCAVYDNTLEEIRKTSAQIIDENSFIDLLENNRILFFGDGAEKCKAKIIHPNATFMNGVFPSAKSMIALSEKAFQTKQFEDIAYFEPYYLKDFVATIPKK